MVTDRPTSNQARVAKSKAEWALGFNFHVTCKTVHTLYHQPLFSSVTHHKKSRDLTVLMFGFVHVFATDNNVALEMMHIALATIDGTRGEPHKIAMIAAAMCAWEAYATETGNININPIL